MDDKRQPPKQLTERHLAGLEQMGMSFIVHSLFEDKPSLAKETGKTLEEIEGIERALRKESADGKTGSAEALTSVLRRTVSLLGGSGISVYMNDDLKLSIRKSHESDPSKK